MTLSIRAVEASEAPRLANLGAMLFRQAYEVTHPEPTLSQYLASSFAIPRVARTLEDSASTIFVVESSGTWIGYAELHRGAPIAPTTVLARPLPGAAPLEIVRFYVDKEWQGRGVAQALMRACEDHARLKACDVIWLQAWQSAAQAVRFYQKEGFEIHGTAVYHFGERVDADFILARRLTGAG
jgi:GNAT superfamily N-acetyltransferase